MSLNQPHASHSRRDSVTNLHALAQWDHKLWLFGVFRK